MSTEILNKIFNNVLNDLPLLHHYSDKLCIYEKEKGKWYIKSLDSYEREKLVYNEKNNETRPEEIVRQLFLYELINVYGYPKERIKTEQKVVFGREIKKKSADIVIYQEDKITPWIIVEVKSPYVKNNTRQLISYLNAEGSPIGVAVNGIDITILFRPYPKKFDNTLPDIPYEYEYQQIKDSEIPAAAIKDIVLSRHWTLDVLNDINEKKRFNLRKIIEGLEELVLANSGVDSFNEIFKLIYAKLFDEMQSKERDNQILLFRQYASPELTYRAISQLFEEAKQEWRDVFDDNDVIKLTPEHLESCVGKLTEVKLYGANLNIIDEAFEYLVPEVSKSKKGQYFTPRIIIDATVRMLNPKRKEYILDPACGSSGFLVHSMQYIWNKYNLRDNDVRRTYACKYLWGIDFDEKSTKISRAIMLIAGDGKSHIYKDNSLAYKNWGIRLKDDLKEERLLTKNDDYKNLKFNIIMTNPPFAGDLPEKHIINLYDDILTKQVSKIDLDKTKKKLEELLFPKEMNDFDVITKILKDTNKDKSLNFENHTDYLKAAELLETECLALGYDISKDEILQILILKDNAAKTRKIIDLDKTKRILKELLLSEEQLSLMTELVVKLKEFNKNKELDLSNEEDYDMVCETISSIIIDKYPSIEINAIYKSIEVVENIKTSDDYDTVDRDIIFIQRCIDMLDERGRMGIILPQGVFNNSNTKYIREFIMSKCRILAVIGLPGNTFLPHTGTKTSLLLLRKWGSNNNKPIIKDDYPIFFASSKVQFKDNSGNYTYVEDETKTLIIKTDLFDIADEFVKWGQEQYNDGDKDFDFLIE